MGALRRGYDPPTNYVLVECGQVCPSISKVQLKNNLALIA